MFHGDNNPTATSSDKQHFHNKFYIANRKISGELSSPKLNYPTARCENGHTQLDEQSQPLLSSDANDIFAYRFDVDNHEANTVEYMSIRSDDTCTDIEESSTADSCITCSEIGPLPPRRSSSRCGLDEKEDLDNAALILCHIRRMKYDLDCHLKEDISSLRIINEKIETLQRKLIALKQQQTQREVVDFNEYYKPEVDVRFLKRTNKKKRKKNVRRIDKKQTLKNGGLDCIVDKRTSEIWTKRKSCKREMHDVDDTLEQTSKHKRKRNSAKDKFLQKSSLPSCDKDCP